MHPSDRPSPAFRFAGSPGGSGRESALLQETGGPASPEYKLGVANLSLLVCFVVSHLPNRVRATRGLLIGGTVMFLLGTLWIVGDLLTGVFRRDVQSSRVDLLARASVDCRRCHEDVYRVWADSHHAQANRVVDAARDASAFTTSPEFSLDGVDYRVSWNGRPNFREQRHENSSHDYTADFVLGYQPLRQYIVPTTGGRYQALELAFDPAKQEWFDVFGAEGRRQGEWGHWTGRGMNWNSMCAHCHMTEFAKNYDPATDTYASTWLEHGVGCVQCHDNLSADHNRVGYKTPEPTWRRLGDRSRSQQTCAPCHARNEFLTGEPRPGMEYNDHFRVTLPVDPNVFYPDGQVRDEDFNWTSLLTSRMGGKAGVTCLDCHEPHSGKTRLPVVDNALCLQCHAGSNPKGAPVIDPTAHSHHQPGSNGNQCVTCHMPTTTYMQRDSRHDHGFLKPDPLLTKKLGIPNACDRCHADRGIDWQIEASEKWYGEKLDSRQRQRAFVVDAAQRNVDDAPARLLELIGREDVPAWKATLLLLARPWASEANVKQAALGVMSDSDPLVRSAAVQILSSTPDMRPQLQAALHDPVRLVRIDAESALAGELTTNSPERHELDVYLRQAADQPVGQLRIGQDFASRGRFVEAEAALSKANHWDPNSAGLHEALGLLLNESGRHAAASAEFWRAAQLDRTNAPMAFAAALSFASAGKLTDAEAALRESVRRDPALHRAWYNLGLLLAQTQRTAEGVSVLEHAERLAPEIAAYPYARATILWSMGDIELARTAARRVLELEPNNQSARQILFGEAEMR